MSAVTSLLVIAIVLTVSVVASLRWEPTLSYGSGAEAESVPPPER